MFELILEVVAAHKPVKGNRGRRRLLDESWPFKRPVLARSQLKSWMIMWEKWRAGLYLMYSCNILVPLLLVCFILNLPALKFSARRLLRSFISFSSYKVPCAETLEGGKCPRCESLWLRPVQEAEHGSGAGSDPQDAPREEQDHLPSSHAAGTEPAWILWEHTWRGLQLGQGMFQQHSSEIWLFKAQQGFSSRICYLDFQILW